MLSETIQSQLRPCIDDRHLDRVDGARRMYELIQAEQPWETFMGGMMLGGNYFGYFVMEAAHRQW